MTKKRITNAKKNDDDDDDDDDQQVVDNNNNDETIAVVEKNKQKRRKGRKSSAVSVPSTTVAGSGTFLDRIETSLVTSSSIVSTTSSKKKKRKKDDDDDNSNSNSNSNDVDDNDNDDEIAEVIDVEEQLKLNRKKQKKRKKLQKSKNKHAVVDPRLFPSYYNEEEKDEDDDDNNNNNNNINDDDDELSMDDFDDGGDDNEGLTSKNNTRQIDRSNQRLMSVIQGRKMVELSVLPLPLPLPLPTTTTTTTRNSNRNDHKKRLSDAQRKGIVHDVQPDKDTISFASPRRLLEIESGRAILVTAAINSNTTTASTTRNGSTTISSTMIVAAATATSAPVTPDEVTTITSNGLSLSKKIASGDVRDFEAANTECGIVGGAWRGFLRRRMMRSIDDVNALSLGRQMQLSIPFLTGYESYLVGQIIEVLDGMAPSSSSSTEEVSSRKRKRQSRRENKNETNYILKIAFKNRNVSRIIVQNVGSRWDFFWHWFNQICRSRWYDAWGQIPMIGFTRFPVTENFPATRNHVLASIFCIFLGPDNWFTRVLTQNRQGLITDDPNKNIAQNLAAESNGFEVANRNQFGTHVGRLKTNKFRIVNRLPVDESIVRTFVASPMSTMINNGVVHVLRQLAKHWHKILAQPFGDFAHQRMEQLDPFETMRFHLPIVCVVLSSLRGRNTWDARILGPFLNKCQRLTTSFTTNECLNLTKEMLSKIIPDLCAGVASVEEPLTSWIEAIQEAWLVVEKEAKEVYEKVTGVEIGLRFGHDLITQVSWKIPSDLKLQKAILLQLEGKYPGEVVGERRIRSALLSITPRDKRTLIGLVSRSQQKSRPVKLLLGRVAKLLKRNIRREYLNEAIRELSMGELVFANNLEIDDWYWLEDKDKKSVHIYRENHKREDGTSIYRFVHVDSGVDRFVTFDDPEVLKCQRYIPVAESIVRAQRCYMNLELDHGHKFRYNAFMEFSFLRTALRRLAVVSQIFCEELDAARLNVLREVKALNQVKVKTEDLEPGQMYFIHDSFYDVYAPFVCQKKYSPSDPEWKKLEQVEIVSTTPQNVVVVGGGPTGLMTVIHCTENVLISGGEMKLYDSRVEFELGGSTFERAQIVRLDARWIAMLRYHLGTGFEDVFIPASGETNAQLGNNSPTQGFVEITIKDLECMLHAEVSRLWSKGVIGVFTESKAQYDVASNSLTKSGEHLKLGDKILRRVDPNGNPSKEFHRWKISDILYAEALGIEDLRVGEEYGVHVKQENAIFQFTLIGVDLQTRTYNFKSQKKKIDNLAATTHNLPPIYPKGTSHADANMVVITCSAKGDTESFYCEHFPVDELKGQQFVVDIGYAHVVECIGKPYASPDHFQITTAEPYGVCCCSGLKISMEMHNFGEKRWGQGLLDDFRSIDDKNTRINGDFTKMVRQPRIAEEMVELIHTENWQLHFEALVEESNFCSLNDKEPIVPKLVEAVAWHANHAREFRRQTLQTRLFETGDNFYLGMEFTREYEKWKNETVDKLVSPLEQKKRIKEKEKRNIEKLRGILRHNIDRLWYEACLEVIRLGDVYNPGAWCRVPRLHLINSYIEEDLENLSVGDSFRLTNKMKEKFEILVKNKTDILARNVEGVLTTFETTTKVFREGNLTRSPDGNTESKVAIATFPVSHYVNHRSIRLNNESKGYVFAFLGDEQSTPHFMRYSGLTGGCINAMQFNNFVRSAIVGVPFVDRLRLYSHETNWSNGEVIQRGTMTCFGQDGFLRPGFSYKHGMKYLQSKVIELIETKQNLDNILSRDWKIKFAASMVPRGMELNDNFLKTLKEDIDSIIFYLFLVEVMNDKDITYTGIEDIMLARREKISKTRSKKKHANYWKEYFAGLKPLFDDASQKRLQDFHCEIAKRMELVVSEVIDFAKESYLYDQRFSQELWNQPKPVDSIVDDFAVEAQNFANSLALSAVFSAAAVALVLYDARRDDLANMAKIWGAIVSVLNIVLSFDTMTNSARYKLRNEEARTVFFDKRFLSVRKAIFSAIDKEDRENISEDNNPFLEDLENRKQQFVEDVVYYGLENPDEFIYDYRRLVEQNDQPAAFKQFQKLLVTYYIPDVYHVNSYVQESLVELHKVCDAIHSLLTQNDIKSHRKGKEKVPHLFERIVEFGPRLGKSLQRGHIYWGFLQQRKFFDWNVCVVFRYFLSHICCSSSDKKIPLSSIENETYGIIKETRIVSKAHKGAILKREIRDMEYLYWATRERDVGSMLFVSAFLVFVVSWIFIISRIITWAGGPSVVADIAFWSQLASVIGALLATVHFVRKLFILLGLWITLVKKVKAGTLDTSTHDALRRIRNVTFIQILLTMARLCAVLGSTVALPWSVVQNAFPEKNWYGKSIPIWIALGAFCVAVGSTMFFFLVEYVVRYNLPPKLGEYVCEAFRGEIEYMYKGLSIPENQFDTRQVQQRVTWEYVAREFLHKYRFDTVFAADRFGSILQYLQCSMEKGGESLEREGIENKKRKGGRRKGKKLRDEKDNAEES